MEEEVIQSEDYEVKEDDPWLVEVKILVFKKSSRF